jgi:peptidoglycan/LPS O-acetylase OafA/YrhL
MRRAAEPVVPAPPAAPVAGYLPALDGLRALAVLAVVAYHLGELSGGFAGVDVFFVISGFLITRLLLVERERDGRISLRAFWGRRFRRLLPALLVVLVAVALGSRAWLPAWRLGDIRADALAALAYVANWRFILSGQSYFSSGVAPSPLRHTWSLAIEEQFYVLWPLVVFGLARLRQVPLRRAVAVGSIVGMATSATWMAVAAAQGRDLSRIYYGTDTRAFAIFAGAWLATWWDPARQRAGAAAARRWSLAGAVAAVPLVAFFVLGSTEEVATYQGGLQVVAALSLVLVAGAASGVGALCRVLALRPLVWLGRRSYGIYLWSWPVQVFASEGFAIEGLALDGLVVASAIALAALSHWLVEEPVRTGRRPAGFPVRGARARRARPPVPRLAFSASAVAVVVAVVVASAIGAPDAPDFTRVSDEEAVAAALEPDDDAAAAARAELTTTTLAIDEGPPGPFFAATTRFADPDASVDPATIHGRPLSVMIAGDSVGWSLGWRLGEELTPSIELTDRAIIGCGLMPRRAAFIVGDRAPEGYGRLCDEVDDAERLGLASQPDVVLLWIGAWEVYDHRLDGVTYEVGTDEYAEVLEGRIQQRVDWYRALGIPTVIPKVTCFGPNAARLGKERRDPERIEWVNRRIRAVSERNRGWVRLIDPTAKLCDDEGQPIAETPEGLPLREDGAHFVPETAVWFWNTWLAGQLGAVLDVPPPAPEEPALEAPAVLAAEE